MIMDDLLEFCDATALNTGAAASYLIGDVIDLQGGNALTSPAPARGEPMWLVITVDTQVTSGGAGTYAFTLASDAQAAIAVDGSATVHYVTPAIPKATLAPGYVIAAVALPLSPAYERYLGILQTTGVAAATAGKVNAFLTHDVALWRAYADAVQ